jgi:hypothetical protein
VERPITTTGVREHVLMLHAAHREGMFPSLPDNELEPDDAWRIVRNEFPINTTRPAWHC